MTRVLQFDALWDGAEWLRPGWIEVDDRGFVAAIGSGEREQAETFGGYAIPGMPNLHSHAFQRAFAGHAEARARDASREDDFWSWRNTMYDCADRLEADDVEAIAAWSYVEMLEAGYSSCAEFHYLHHQRDASSYESASELGRRVISAAASSGIEIRLLPVLYLHGGFGEPLSDAQRRFGHHSVEDFLSLCSDLPRERLGLALHSLRAVALDEIDVALTGFDALAPGAVRHIHIAEQQGEVDDCLAHHGKRPVELLVERFDVDAKWCLVHATHVDEGERRALAASGAVAGLCPTTEANLGDGFFPLGAFIDDGGTYGIGSDSQIEIDAFAELRLLEYGQRLQHERRNLATNAAGMSSGAELWKRAAGGGARALGLSAGPAPGAHDSALLALGARADLVVLDAQHPRALGHDHTTILDAAVFSRASTRGFVKDVLVGGEVVVRDGRHIRRDEILAAFSESLERLAAR